MNFQLNVKRDNRIDSLSAKEHGSDTEKVSVKSNAVDVEVSKSPAVENRFFKRIRIRRMPGVVIFVFLGILLGLSGMSAFIYFHSDPISYPEGDVEPSVFISDLDEYEYSSEGYSFSDYALPLPKLPENYDVAKDLIGGSWQREQMILVLRNGFVVVPYDEGSQSFGQIYEDLSSGDFPLMLTRDAVFAYAFTIFGEAQSAADEEITNTLEDFLGDLGDLALGRSRSGEDDAVNAYRQNAVNYSVALKILSPDTEVPGDIRSAVDERYQEFTESRVWVEDDPLSCAMNYLNRMYASEDDDSLRMRIISAALMKRSECKDRFLLLSAYLSYYYGEGDFFDIDAADEAVRSTVGYGVDDEEALSDEVIGYFESLLSQSDDRDRNSETTPDILQISSLLGIPKACELNGNADGLCVEDEQDYSHGGDTFADFSYWVSRGVRAKTDNVCFNYVKSSDWEKQGASKSLWALNYPKLEKVTEEDASISFELSDERDVYLDPNPTLYSRLAYGAKLIAQGLANLALIDGEVEENLSLVAEDMENLTEFSNAVLSGEDLDADESEVLRDVIERMARSLNVKYLDADSEVTLFAVRDAENRLNLAVGPTISYIPDFSESEVMNGETGEHTQTDGGEDSEALASERVEAINSFLDWLPITVRNDNFDEQYSWGVVAQAAGTVRIPVLMYHQITPSPVTTAVRRLYVKPESFEEQLAYLTAMNYRALTPQEFYDQLATGKNPTQKSVMLTFDDSVSNHYTNAFPLLQKYGYTGVFYVVSHKSGITTAQLKEMSDAGMIIDSHSETHRDFTKIDDAALWEEIGGSKAALEAVTGKTIVSMCYPGCTVDDRGINIVASSGYKLGFSCGRAIDHTFNNRFVLSRIHVYEEMDNFQQIFSGIWGIPASYYQ